MLEKMGYLDVLAFLLSLEVREYRFGLQYLLFVEPLNPRFRAFVVLLSSFLYEVSRGEDYLPFLHGEYDAEEEIRRKGNPELVNRAFQFFRAETVREASVRKERFHMWDKLRENGLPDFFPGSRYNPCFHDFLHDIRE